MDKRYATYVSYVVRRTPEYESSLSTHDGTGDIVRHAFIRVSFGTLFTGFSFFHFSKQYWLLNYCEPHPILLCLRSEFKTQTFLFETTQELSD
jgi:hypothetical protein